MRAFILAFIYLLSVYPILTFSSNSTAISVINNNENIDKSNLCQDTKNCYTNDLINEKSAYLLQHAHNPVNWSTWNNEALERAKKENKPIFLSIGYASCHWCHVMEKESFSNVEIANLINANFIPIKVDRELRPDIDEFYGNAVMIFSGQIGWPMSVFLTPDTKPFYGGGYYNKEDFSAVLVNVADNWKKQPARLIEKANDIVSSINANTSAVTNTVNIDDALRQQAIKSLLSFVDDYSGGFGEGTKFPREPWLYLLLDHSYAGEHKSDSWNALRLTLDKMADGGIYDQLGGGFHRYAIDPYWHVPHFEKMLYNQALLIRLYLRSNAFHVNEQYKYIAIQTLGFLIDELQAPNGGFYSSMGAESEDIEGKYYSWSEDEVDNILTADESKIAREIYAIDKYGDIDNQKNVLYIASSVKEYAKNNNIPVNQLQLKLIDIRHKLLSKRNKRTKPLIDNKIIMAWNGLTITALSEASMYLNNPRYLKYAIKLANLIWDDFQSDSGFYRINYMGISEVDAQLDDYAYYLQALISLYDVDKNKQWLERAIAVSTMMIDKFWDEKNGGFYNVPINQKAALLIRPKTAFDKTLPSANSIAAQMFIRLAKRTGNDDYQDKAKVILSNFYSALKVVPTAYSGLLVAAHELQNEEKDLPAYAANGHVRIDAYINRINKQQNNSEMMLSVELSIDDKWHINSNKPLDRSLIPLMISSGDEHIRLENIVYPQHNIVTLGFSKSSLAIYKGNNVLKSKITIEYDSNPIVKIGLQSCNDKICLAPEEYTLYPRFIN